MKVLRVIFLVFYEVVFVATQAATGGHWHPENAVLSLLLTSFWLLSITWLVSHFRLRLTGLQSLDFKKFNEFNS